MADSIGTVRADLQGESIKLDLRGATALRGALSVQGAAIGALVARLLFRPVFGRGVFREINTAHRLDTTTPAHTTPIDVSGLEEVMMEVFTKHATASTYAEFSLGSS